MEIRRTGVWVAGRDRSRRWAARTTPAATVRSAARVGARARCPGRLAARLGRVVPTSPGRGREPQGLAPGGPRISPSRMTTWPRRTVATGQPVTSRPSKGVQPQRLRIIALVMVSRRRQVHEHEVGIERPRSIRPLPAMPKTRAGPVLVRSTTRSRLRRPGVRVVEEDRQQGLHARHARRARGVGLRPSPRGCGARGPSPPRPPPASARPPRAPRGGGASRMGGFIWARVPRRS